MRGQRQSSGTAPNFLTARQARNAYAKRILKLAEENNIRILINEEILIWDVKSRNTRLKYISGPTPQNRIDEVVYLHEIGHLVYDHQVTNNVPQNTKQSILDLELEANSFVDKHTQLSEKEQNMLASALLGHVSAYLYIDKKEISPDHSCFDYLLRASKIDFHPKFLKDREDRLKKMNIIEDSLLKANMKEVVQKLKEYRVPN